MGVKFLGRGREASPKTLWTSAYIRLQSASNPSRGLIVFGIRRRSNAGMLGYIFGFAFKPYDAMMLCNRAVLSWVASMIAVIMRSERVERKVWTLLSLADVRLDSDIVRKVDEGGGRKKEISAKGRVDKEDGDAKMATRQGIYRIRKGLVSDVYRQTNCQHQRTSETRCGVRVV